MSQEPPKSQPPLPSEPEAQQPQTTVNQEIPTRQVTANRVQTVLKTQSIKALRGTIRVLEGVVVKLEAEPSATTTPTFLDKLQTGWSAILAKIRSVLPENLTSKLSDTALTGIITGVTVILVWTTFILLPGKPATEVANAPSSVAEPEKKPEIVNPPSSVAEPEKTPEIVNPPAPKPIPSANATPPELTAPAEPQPVESIPTPTPVVELTPEQTLIAAIENQVAEISDRFADGLIQSIQVNFAGSSLTIKVGDDWYTLPQPQQDKLATRMLERARELDFTRLEITDPTGTLLARSPVVGNNMVILKR